MQDHYNIIHNLYQLFYRKIYGNEKYVFNPTVSALNLNPYTVTTELRTFTIKCECHNTQWFLAGNGTGALGTILLYKAFNK